MLFWLFKGEKAEAEQLKLIYRQWHVIWKLLSQSKCAWHKLYSEHSKSFVYHSGITVSLLACYHTVHQVLVRNQLNNMLALYLS